MLYKILPFDFNILSNISNNLQVHAIYSSFVILSSNASYLLMRNSIPRWLGLIRLVLYGGFVKMVSMSEYPPPNHALHSSYAIFIENFILHIFSNSSINLLAFLIHFLHSDIMNYTNHPKNPPHANSAVYRIITINSIHTLYLILVFMFC